MCRFEFTHKGKPISSFNRFKDIGSFSYTHYTLYNQAKICRDSTYIQNSISFPLCAHCIVSFIVSEGIR